MTSEGRVGACQHAFAIATSSNEPGFRQRSPDDNVADGLDGRGRPLAADGGGVERVEQPRRRRLVCVLCGELVADPGAERLEVVGRALKVGVDLGGRPSTRRLELPPEDVNLPAIVRSAPAQRPRTREHALLRKRMRALPTRSLLEQSAPKVSSALSSGGRRLSPTGASS